jgi:hypothetical protein
MATDAHFTPEEDKEILRMRLVGFTYQQIAACQRKSSTDVARRHENLILDGRHGQLDLSVLWIRAMKNAKTRLSH